MGSVVIAVSNHKGGVGKTTTVLNLGAAFVEKGYRVCVIDADPQAHATLGLGLKPESSAGTLCDVMVEKVESLRTIVVRTRVPNLLLAPSHRGLVACETVLSGLPHRHQILDEAIAQAGLDVDFYLIDCPPNLGIMNMNALYAAPHYIMPIEAKLYGFHGTASFGEFVQLVRKTHRNPQCLGVLITMFDKRTNLHALYRDNIHTKFAGLTFKTAIPDNVAVSEAEPRGIPVVLYEPHSAAAMAYREVGEEILERLAPEVGPPQHEPPNLDHLESGAIRKAQEAVRREAECCSQAGDSASTTPAQEAGEATRQPAEARDE
jgi:chromosome partitioning protein